MTLKYLYAPLDGNFVFVLDNSLASTSAPPTEVSIVMNNILSNQTFTLPVNQSLSLIDTMTISGIFIVNGDFSVSD